MTAARHDRPRRVVLVFDTSRPMYGLHGLHAAFRGLPGVEVTAIADPGEATARRAAAMEISGATRHYAEVETMFDQERPDIAVICSRHPDEHLAPIRAAAARGIHLFCEKPLAATAAAAREIAALAAANGIKLAVVHPARFDAAFLEMKRLVESGAIGRPLTVIGRGKCDARGGGEDLIVLGTHILDLMVFFLGKPLSIMADIQVDGRPATPADWHAPTEPVGPVAGDDILATFTFAGGVRGLFESRKGLRGAERPGDTLMGLSVVGADGTLSLRFDDVRRRELKLSRRAAAPDDEAAYEPVPVPVARPIPGAAPPDLSLCGRGDIPRAPMFVEAVRWAAWDLLQAIGEDRQPLFNADSACVVAEMIEAIYTAHFEGRRIVWPSA